MLAGKNIAARLSSLLGTAAPSKLPQTRRSFIAPSAVGRQGPQQTSGQHKTDGSQSEQGALQQQPSQTTPAPVYPQADALEMRPSRPLFYHDQMEWLDERQVRISKPTKNVMQSGTVYTNCWKIEFDSQPRSEYWLMGWTGSADPMSNLTLTFPTKEKAIEFCERNKLHWFVEEQSERKIRKKSYADNFSWNKRTRNGTK